MSSRPFDGAPSLTDWLLVALMGYEQTWDTLARAGALCASIGPGTVTVFPRTRYAPSVVVWVGNDLVIVSTTGTTQPWEGILECLGSAQGSLPRIPGSVSLYFGAAGQWLYGHLADYLSSVSDGRSLVFIGHSLGAALAQIQTSLALLDGLPVAGCYCQGAPRVGDSTFASSIAGSTWRLENVGDPIVSVPPVLWAGVGSAFPVPGPGPLATYTHAGTAWTMDSYGLLTPGSNPMPLSEAAVQFSKLAAPDHLAGEYARRIRVQWTGAEYLQPGAQGYADPSVLGALWIEIIPATRAEYQQQVCELDC